jgi:hypothetical protein
MTTVGIISPSIFGKIMIKELPKYTVLKYFVFKIDLSLLDIKPVS